LGVEPDRNTYGETSMDFTAIALALVGLTSWAATVYLLALGANLF
jgi:hypothetical protein